MNSGMVAVNIEPLRCHFFISVIVQRAVRVAGCAQQWLEHVHDNGKRVAVYAGDMTERSDSVPVQVGVHDGHV